MSVCVTEGCSVKLDLDSDGYHMCLLFLILDLHKSEVGPSNIYFFHFFFPFFFPNVFFSPKFNFLLKITKNCFTGFPVFPRVYDTRTTS